ncbi:MAG: peptidylprolyl isomerase [Rhodospirillaceae bacterium]|nr:peptidylprolyl isomerase [Rhodospirillaceae bacterium]
MNRYLKSMLTIVAIASIGAGVFSEPANGEEQDPLLARVDGYEIRLSEVEEARTLLPPALQRTGTTDVITLLVETIIDTRLAAKRAKELGLDKGDEYKQTISRIEGQILKRMLFSKEIEKSISEEGIKKRYNELVKNTPTGDELHARHILVESEAKAKEIIKKLDDGADFNAAAVEHSIGPSAPSGGDLGWFGQGAMVAEFEKEAYSLDVGAHSKAGVKTRFGWHVIRVEGRRKAKVPTLDMAREEVIRQLSSEIGQKLLDGLRKNAKVERFKIEEPK